MLWWYSPSLPSLHRSSKSWTHALELSTGSVHPHSKVFDKGLSKYCGITLQSVIAKVFEQKKKFLWLLDSNLHDEIHPLQGGFKPDVSCLHTWPLCSRKLYNTQETKRKKAYVALLDVQKASDTVGHNGLFHKLYSYGIKDHTWHLLRSWYQSTTCTVLWDGEQSHPFSTRQGVKQGAVLSPLLYRLFVNDLLLELEHSGLSVRIGSVFCGAPMYADNHILIACSPEDLQSMINFVAQYATRWRYCLNPHKSKVCVFALILHPPPPGQSRVRS